MADDNSGRSNALSGAGGEAAWSGRKMTSPKVTFSAAADYLHRAKTTSAARLAVMPINKQPARYLYFSLPRGEAIRLAADVRIDKVMTDGCPSHHRNAGEH